MNVSEHIVISQKSNRACSASSCF